MAYSDEPFGLARIAVVDGIEDEFDAGGDTQLVEDAEQVLLDGVLAEVKLAGSVAIAEAFGDEGDDLLLARGEELVAGGIENAKRRHLRDQVKQEVHLFRVDPDLTGGDSLNAAAEQAEVGIGNAENTAGAGAESADDEFPVVGLDQKNLGDVGMGKMDAAYGGHLAGDIGGVIQRKHNHPGRSGCDRLEERGGVDQAGEDAELGAPA